MVHRRSIIWQSFTIFLLILSHQCLGETPTLNPFDFGGLPDFEKQISTTESFSCIGSGCYVGLLSMFKSIYDTSTNDVPSNLHNIDIAGDNSLSADSLNQNGLSAWNALMIDPVIYGCKTMIDCIETGQNFEIPREVILKQRASKIRVYVSERSTQRPRKEAVLSGVNFLKRSNITNKLDLHIVEGKAFGWMNMLKYDDISQECGNKKWPWIMNCNIDAPKLVFSDAVANFDNHVPPEEIVNGSLYAFNQSLTSEIGSGYAKIGYVYIPEACQNRLCHIHLHLSHCMHLPGISTLNPKYNRRWFARYNGLNEWAEKNNIIVIYPQIASTITEPPNARACFDYYGITTHKYYHPSAPQVKSLENLKQLFRDPKLRVQVLLRE